MHSIRLCFLCICGLLLSACASSRILRIENRVLLAENGDLNQELDRLKASVVDPRHFSKVVSLEAISKLLTETGYRHEVSKEKTHISMEYSGQNTKFTVNIQYYPKAEVVFIATDKYFSLDKAQHSSSVVLLAVQLMALNYELLLGKFQMNPESGEILLSTEIYVGDGLGHATFLQALDHLCRTADKKIPDLERAASGVGL